MDLYYPIHLLKMKLLDLEHENEKLEDAIGRSWSNVKANQYCDNLPTIEALQKAIDILSNESQGQHAS